MTDNNIDKKVDRQQQYFSDAPTMPLTTNVDQLSEKDKETLSSAYNKQWTNPKFKLKWFVGQTQITPFAKLRQWMLELRSREESLQQILYDNQKWEVERDRNQWIADNTEDQFDKRLAQIEADNESKNLDQSRKKLREYYLERQNLIDLINEFLESDEALLPDGSGRTYMDILNTEEEDVYEAEYWTNRLAKQASADLVFYGRINTGNMDAILSMAPEQQTETLGLALSYASQLQQVQTNLQLEVDEKLKLGAQPTKDLLTPQPMQEQITEQEPGQAFDRDTFEPVNNKDDDFDLYNS
tara:strand:+ start:840 stop:1733 length:894 start_codon:yes stop_codon:yes gene_type:complete